MTPGLRKFALTVAATDHSRGRDALRKLRSFHKKKLKATAGVEDVNVSFEKKEAWVKFDDQKLTVAKKLRDHKQHPLQGHWKKNLDSQ